MGGQSQPKWDKYEAVILLDAWLNIQNGAGKEAEIKRVSNDLRQLAVKRKIEIDDVYRNETGITLQMVRMRDTFLGGKENSHASRLFMKIVDLYKYDRPEYDRVLMDAKQMVSNDKRMNLNSKIEFLNFDEINNVSNSEPVALYYKDYVISNINSWYDLYLHLKNIIKKERPDVSGYLGYVDDKPNSSPQDIVIAIKNNFELYNLDLSLLSITYRSLIVSEYNTQNRNESSKTELLSSNVDFNKNCMAVLESEFEDGYILGNYMHKMRFSSFYEEKYGSDINEKTNDIDKLLSEIGVVVDDRVYAASVDVSSDVLDKIYDDIMMVFDNFGSVVNVESVFEKYNKELASELNIYTSDTLYSFLKSNPKFSNSFILDCRLIMLPGNDNTLSNEVRNRLKNSSKPVTAVELHETMWYTPVESLKGILRQLPESILVDSSAYYYGPNFYIATEEKNNLIKSMTSEIYSKGYLATKKLRSIFENSCPSAFLDSKSFKDCGIRELLKFVLGDIFEFNDSVITEKGTNMNLRQVFRDFAHDHETLTLEEIKDFKLELGASSIYWNDIYKEMIRISSNELVRKDKVNFNVESTDEVLEVICPDKYIALKDINLFLSFPDCGYRWNGFVLESYLREYSKKFTLIQVSFSADSYNGVMVRKNAGFESYEEVAADLLSKSQEWNNESSALNVLTDAGFQQRAKNKNIGVIIKMAKGLRENK